MEMVLCKLTFHVIFPEMRMETATKKNLYSIKSILWTMSLIAYLVYLTFEAMLKFYAVSYHIAIVQYIPRILIVISLVCEFATLRVKKAHLIVGCLLVYSVAVAMCNNRPLVQVAYAVYFWLPVFLGIGVAWIILVNQERWVLLMFFLLLCCTAGVVVDMFIDFPWSSFTYSSFGRVLEGSRESSYLGRLRPSGFSCIHWTSASLALFFGLYVVVFCKRRSFRIIAWLIAGTTIFTTYTKGLLLVYFVISVLLLLPRRMQLRCLKLIAISALVLIVFLPLVSSLTPEKRFFVWDMKQDLFRSLDMRFGRVWPESVHMIVGSSHPIVGYGLGSTGAASIRFAEHTLVTDNSFLYMWANFGICGIVLGIAACWRSLRKKAKSRNDVFRYYLLIAMLLYGVLVNLIEFGVFAFVIGIMLSWITKPNLSLSRAR